MPNQGVPVIFKNKIAYGYAEKSVQAYDVSVSDYNALTEQQQLDGSIRFIQGVDAIPNGSNVWAKLGTTPLAEGLPRDCSQAVNELKSNLTEFKNGEVIYENSTVYSGDMNLLKSVEDYKAITLILRATGSSLPANLYQGSSMFVPKEVFTDSSINNQGFKISMFGGTSVYADANLKFNGNKITITQGSHAGWTYIIVYKIIGYK